MSRDWCESFPEPTQWNGDDLRPMPSVESSHAEEIRERDWHDMQASARDFVQVYGAAALLRCISESLK